MKKVTDKQLLESLKHNKVLYEELKNALIWGDNIKGLKEDKDRTALWCTIIYAANTELLKQLLENGADPNSWIDNPDMAFPLCYILSNHHLDYLEDTKLLLEAGADPNCFHEKGLSPILIAAVNEQTELLGAVLKAGGNPEITNPYLDEQEETYFHNGFTYLASKYTMSLAGNFKLLCQYGNPNTENLKGWNMLRYCLSDEKHELFKAAVEAGVDPNLLNEGRTILHQMVNDCPQSSLSMLYLLSEKKIDLNRFAAPVLPPIQEAILGNKLEAFSLLKEGGADPMVKNENGQDAAQFAKSIERPFYAAYLSRLGLPELPILAEIKEALCAGLRLRTKEKQELGYQSEKEKSWFSVDGKKQADFEFDTLLLTLSQSQATELSDFVNGFRDYFSFPKITPDQLKVRAKAENEKALEMINYEPSPVDFQSLIMAAFENGMGVYEHFGMTVEHSHIKDGMFSRTKFNETRGGLSEIKGGTSETSKAQFSKDLLWSLRENKQGQYAWPNNWYKSALDHFKVQNIKEWLSKRKA